MLRTSESDADLASRTVVIRRIFDAPRDLVFAAWTERRHVARWWRPKVFETIEIQKMDVRPGGALRFVFRTTAGDEFLSKCVYGEIVRPERLTYDEACYENGRLFHRAHQTVTFEEVSGKTRLTLEGRLDLVAERDPSWTLATMKQGWEAGWTDNLDLLDRHLADVARAPAEALVGRELTLTRVFDAPRDRVFAAWTDPKLLARWWGPKGFTNPVCEFEARPGGAIRIDMRAPDGLVYPMTGVVHEIAPPERLVFMSGALDAGGELVFKVLNTVTLVEQDGKTSLVVNARVIEAKPEAARYLPGMEQGWSETLDRLADLVDPERERR